MASKPALPEEVARLGPAFGGRWPETVRVERDDTLLAAWQEVEPKLRRLAAALGVPRSEIEDVLQDVYLSAQKSVPALDEEPCRRWLFRVAVNRCRLEHRRRKRWRTVWERLREVWAESIAASGLETAAKGEEQQALRRALRQLPPELRNPILLRYYCDLNSSEIGQVLDLPAATVRGQLSAARKRLAASLRAAGFRLEDD